MREQSSPSPFAFSDFPEEKPVDLRLYLGLLRRYWYLFLLFPFLTLSAAWLYLRYTPKTYEVKSTVLIKGQESGSSASDLTEEVAFSDLGSGLLTGSINLENEMQILRSRSLMRGVVDSLNLRVQYLVQGRIAGSELYKRSPVHLDSFVLAEGRKSIRLYLEILDDYFYRLRPYDSEGDSISVKARFGQPFRWKGHTFSFSRNTGEGVSAYKEIIVAISDPDKVAQQYAGKLNVRRREYSYVLELSMKDYVPRKTVDVLNMLYKVYDKAAREDKNAVARNTLQFINERLRYLTGELADVEGTLVEFRKRHVIPAEVEGNVQSLMAQLQEYDQRRADLSLQSALLDRLEEELRRNGRNYQILPAAFSFDQSQLNALIQQYNERILQRQRLLQGGTTDNPAVELLSKELVDLHTSLLENLTLAKEQLALQLQQVESKAEELLGQARTMPAVERDLLQIQRQQSIKENLFLYLLQKREETALSLAVTASDFRIVDPPVLFEARVVKPQAKVIWALSWMLGLGLPVLFIVLLNLMNTKIRSEEDVTSVTDVPILGKVAESSKKKFLVVSKGSRSAVAEMFRLLRTNLNFVLPEGNRQVLLITSGTSGDGKTFITANLGMSIALSGKRTLLVGMDLRKPKLCANLLKKSPEKGLTNYLIGQADPGEIIYPVLQQPDKEEEMLFILPSGPLPPNPAELLLQKEKMQNLMDYLRAQFDVIIIDTPPVGMVADALLINEYIDGAIFVLRDHYTPKEVLKTLDDLYRRGKFKNLSAIINAIKIGSGYGYGYGYGYGKGYGYYEES